MAATGIAAALVVSPQMVTGAVGVDTSVLREVVTVEGVRSHQQALQNIADANDGVRLSGTSGYDASVDYVVAELTWAGYDVQVQAFDFQSFRPTGPSTLEQVAPGFVTYAENTDYNLMSQTDAGDVTGLVTAVDFDLSPGNASTSGCEAGDFAGFPAGDIALIQRGACTFQLKAENAAAAGAIGAIIFNQGNTEDRKGLIDGTLSSDYSGGIPVFFATFDRGAEWIATPGLEMHMIADVFRGTVQTFNVLAETAGGRHDRVVVVGAHLDSVPQGPGIQDNGSGSAAILEIAVQMAALGIEPRNKVRFAWWGAEESGLVGSQFYVDNLSKREIKNIALNLNFDMIGSPNFVRFVYDGNGSETPLRGPAGSKAIEEVFLDYFAEQFLENEPTAFDGRSDYGPFIAVGIPAGGLFTGAEGIKTEEQVLIYGGTAGEQYDPCYHLACDTFDNISLEALDQMSDAAAHAVLTFAMTTSAPGGTAQASSEAEEVASIDDFEFLGSHAQK
ncbi:MAG: M20/M25/M40 family metallo-hydrolase [Alphaproteobacteria bacterium]|nr:M20/M25/M40 family metallo-hydrolase [Alphaproteobacteria bacterium]